MAVTGRNGATGVHGILGLRFLKSAAAISNRNELKVVNKKRGKRVRDGG
jgi:hypothetical protein